MNQSNYFLRRNEDCAYQVIEGEAVIVRLLPDGASRVLSLNSVGTQVWEMADGSSLADISGRVADLFGLEVERALGDVVEFAQELEERGLASIDSRSGG